MKYEIIIIDVIVNILDKITSFVGYFNLPVL